MCTAKSLVAHRGSLAVCAAGGHEHMRDVGGVVKHQAEVHDEDDDRDRVELHANQRAKRSKLDLYHGDVERDDHRSGGV